MSTKATILFGDGFHIYRELADGTIRLELDIERETLNVKPPITYILNGVEGSSENGSVDLVIPRRVLKAILDAKGVFMKDWEHLHDDPIIGMINESLDKQHNEG